MGQVASPSGEHREDSLELAHKLIFLGRDEEALELLSALNPSGQRGSAHAPAHLVVQKTGLPPEKEGERLCLLGFLRARAGDLMGYRALAQEAARIAPTPLTLYHLGLALPPRDGLAALETAWRSWDGLRLGEHGQARLAFALARALRRLGRLEEALGYVSLAVLKEPENPFYRLEEAALDLLVGRTPLAEVEEGLLPLLSHEARGVRLYAHWNLVLLKGMEGHQRGARGEGLKELVLALLRLARPSGLAYHLPLAVMLLRKGEGPLLPRLLRAGWAGLGNDPLARGMLLLAEGLAAFPDLEALPPLREALRLLEEGEGESREEALRARAHLSALEGASFPEPYRRLAHALRPEARPLFLPRGLAWEEPSLYALGEARLVGLPALRPRGLELLVLLLAHPEGLPGERLARLLYGEGFREGGGETPLSALRVEVHRLREAGLEVAARPYRLLTPLRADFLELREALREGNLPKALRLYRGPLLPRSQAPGIEELRLELEGALREGVFRSGDPGLLYGLAQRLGDDLLVWEACLEAMPSKDPRRPAVRAWVERLRRSYWG